MARAFLIWIVSSALVVLCGNGTLLVWLRAKAPPQAQVAKFEVATPTIFALEAPVAVPLPDLVPLPAPAAPAAQLPPVVIPSPLPEEPEVDGPDPSVNPLERVVKSGEMLGSIMKEEGLKCGRQKKVYRAAWRRMNEGLVGRNRRDHRANPQKKISIYRVRAGDRMLAPPPSELREILQVPCK